MVRETHRRRHDEISRRLSDFRDVWDRGTDRDLWEEMVYCFFTGGCSARMGINAVNAVRHLLEDGSEEELAGALKGVHRYPNARSKYVARSREFLQEHCGMRLREKLEDFRDRNERRDWLVKEEGIKGLGYKEASHFLRNVGFRGYAILDKHVLRCLAELKIIEDPKPPNSRTKYLSIEQKLSQFTDDIGIDFDEMDLVLWSIKTGVILK